MTRGKLMNVQHSGCGGLPSEERIREHCERSDAVKNAERHQGRRLPRASMVEIAIHIPRKELVSMFGIIFTMHAYRSLASSETEQK
jgi:hypothetical protein